MYSRSSLSFRVFFWSVEQSRSFHGRSRMPLPTAHFTSSSYLPIFTSSSSSMPRRPGILLSSCSWSPVLQFISNASTAIYSRRMDPNIARGTLGVVNVQSEKMEEQKFVPRDAELHVYHTMNRTNEKCQPKIAGKVSMNVCCVTAYDYSHIGHARAYVAFDVLFRSFRQPGYEVKYVHNFTDVDDKGSEKLPFTSKPLSLSLPPESKLRVVTPEPKGVKGFVLRLLGYYSKQSQLIRGARTLYSRVTSQVEKPALYSTFSLEQSFRTSHAMLVLHIWMCLVRLRTEDDGAALGQFLYEIFNHDLQQRVASAGVKMLLSKWMKELEKNFYGAVIAYDAAMRPEASQDELLGVLWRNVFAEDQSLMPMVSLAVPIQTLARYVHRETACLALTASNALMSGNIVFTCDFEISQK